MDKYSPILTALLEYIDEPFCCHDCSWMGTCACPGLPLGYVTAYTTTLLQ